jgi:hypothetical protein
VVVGQVPPQDASQADFTQDDHMIETLASHGADDAFRVCVLSRGAWSVRTSWMPIPIAVCPIPANA